MRFSAWGLGAKDNAELLHIEFRIAAVSIQKQLAIRVAALVFLAPRGGNDALAEVVCYDSPASADAADDDAQLVPLNLPVVAVDDDGLCIRQ